MKRLIIVAVALGLTACSTLGRLSSYGGGMADANFSFEGRSYSASVHPQEDVVLIRPAAGSGFVQGLKRGATLGMVGGQDDAARHRAVAEHLIDGSGCEVVAMNGLDAQSGYWEATWRCPTGIDLRQLMQDQRDALRGGAVVTR